MKGFPREKNCVIMAENEKCEISLDENKNISMDNIAEKRLSELFEDGFSMEPVQLRHNLKNKEARYRLVGVYLF